MDLTGASGPPAIPSGTLTFSGDFLASDIVSNKVATFSNLLLSVPDFSVSNLSNVPVDRTLDLTGLGLPGAGTSNSYVTVGSSTFFSFSNLGPASLMREMDINGQNTTRMYTPSGGTVVTTINLNSNQDVAPWRISATEVTAVIPEPASLAIWGLGALVCTFGAYRCRKAA
jgi:hypothetical protein